MQNWFELGKHTILLFRIRISTNFCVSNMVFKIIMKGRLYKYDSLHDSGDHPVCPISIGSILPLCFTYVPNFK